MGIVYANIELLNGGDVELSRRKYISEEDIRQININMMVDSGALMLTINEEIREALRSATFMTGDDDLNALLETARAKYLDPDLSIRKESLEKLWDAWERLKTLEDKDKKKGATTLLNKSATEPTFRALLEEDAEKLTAIGNNFRIRHSETTKAPIETSEQVDYLFHRMFALIRLLLKKTHRGG